MYQRTTWDFTPDDLALLDCDGICDVPPSGPAPAWPPERVLRAACAGRITGPDLTTATTSRLVVCIDDEPITDAEYRALVDLLTGDLLVWIGGRITATASGRELAARWATYRPMGGDQP